MPLMRWFTKSKFKEALEFPARLGLEFGGLLAAVVVNKNRASEGARFCFTWLGWLDSNQRPID